MEGTFGPSPWPWCRPASFSRVRLPRPARRRYPALDFPEAPGAVPEVWSAQRAATAVRSAPGPRARRADCRVPRSRRTGRPLLIPPIDGAPAPRLARLDDGQRVVRRDDGLPRYRWMTGGSAKLRTRAVRAGKPGWSPPPGCSPSSAFPFPARPAPMIPGLLESCQQRGVTAWCAIRLLGRSRRLWRVGPRNVSGRAERSRCVVRMGPHGLVTSYLHRDPPPHARQAHRRAVRSLDESRGRPAARTPGT